MKIDLDHNAKLPIRHNLALSYALSLVIAILMTVSSIAGLVYGHALYPTKELLVTFVSNDVANLLIGLPILLGSIWLTRRGKWIGLLCWPGALFVVLYNYLIYILAFIFAKLPIYFLLLYLSLVAVSVSVLLSLIIRIDGTRVRKGLMGAIPEKITGGVLAGLGLLFFLRAIAVIVNSLKTATLIPVTGLAVDISDFLITPAWVIGGIHLWQQKALGYVVGLGLLLQASTLFIALILVMLLQLFLNFASISVSDIAVITAMGLVCFIPFVLSVRGVGKNEPRA